MLEANFNPKATIQLTTGSGARLIFDDFSVMREATCDGSAWADIHLGCAE